MLATSSGEGSAVLLHSTDAYGVAGSYGSPAAMWPGASSATSMWPGAFSARLVGCATCAPARLRRAGRKKLGKNELKHK